MLIVFSHLISTPGSASPVLKRAHASGNNSISPLAMSQMKAATKPEDTKEDDVPFEYGLGTQVMLTSMQTPARELLLAQARRLLSVDEVEDLVKMLEKVRP